MNHETSSSHVSHPWLRRFDRAGSVLSTACAVHCLLMPVVVAALPVLATGLLASRARSSARRAG